VAAVAIDMLFVNSGFFTWGLIERLAQPGTG